jgi:hypothetical protein
MAVFNDDLLQNLKDFISGLNEFAQNNWIWAAIVFVVIIAVVVIQQILLFLSSGAL